MKPNEAEVRAYHQTAWYKRKVARMPAGLLVALVLFAGVAAAALVSKTIQTAQSVQGADIQYKVSTAPPASPVLNSVILTTLQGLGKNGYVGPVKLQVVIGSNSASDTCASLALIISNGASLTGKVNQAVYSAGVPGTAAQLDIATGTGSPAGFAGGCTLTLLATQTYTLTASFADAFDVQWQYIGFPTGSIVTWAFTFST